MTGRNSTLRIARVEVGGDRLRVVGKNLTPELLRALTAAKRVLIVFPGEVELER